VREPLFADFIRQSLKLGYIPVAYEHVRGSIRSENPSDAINEREKGQAAHLMERIFKQKPNARVLIYVGFSHLLKNPQGPAAEPARQTQWMAGRLKKLTGIDPLTIDQVTMTDPGPNSLPAAISQRLFAGAAEARCSEAPAIQIHVPNWPRSVKFSDYVSRRLLAGRVG
jgi:hypothetical protein